MKKVLVLIFILSLCCLTWCKSEQEKAVDYQNELIDIFEKCTKSEEKMFQLLREDAEKSDIASSLDFALSECRSSKKSLEEIDGFGEETELRDALNDLIALEIDYLKLIEQSLVFVDLESLTPDQKNDYSILSENMTTIEQDSRILTQKVIEAQEKFSAKYDFKLQ